MNNNQVEIRSIGDKSLIKSSLRKSFSALVYHIHKIDEEIFMTPLAPGKWSSGDHIGHLMLSTRAARKAFDMSPQVLKLRFGTLNRNEMSYVELQESYYGSLQKGMKSPESFVFLGAKEKGKEAMIQGLISEMNILIQKMDDWTEQDLSACCIPHPALGPLSLRELLYFTDFHTLHHLRLIGG